MTPPLAAREGSGTIFRRGLEGYLPRSSRFAIQLAGTAAGTITGGQAHAYNCCTPPFPISACPDPHSSFSRLPVFVWCWREVKGSPQNLASLDHRPEGHIPPIDVVHGSHWPRPGLMEEAPQLLTCSQI